MKTRTKLLAALLSTVTALSCALTAAAAPAITLQGNEATPADGTNPGTAELKIQATDFKSVAGADLEFTLTSGVTLTGVTITNADGSWTPTNGENYTLKGNNTVKIVDVFSLGSTIVDTLDLTVTISFNAAEIGSYEIVKNAKLVKEDETDITDTVNITTGNFVIGKKTVSEEGSAEGKSFDTENAFLPYGILKDGDTYLEKDNDGKFKFTGPKDITLFKLPVGNATTTFGASYGTLENTIQFGSYIHDLSGVDNCGTVVIFDRELSKTLTDEGYIRGSYEAAVKALGSSDALFKDIIDAFGKASPSKIDSKFHPYAYGADKNNVIYAAVVPQSNYMWKQVVNDLNTKLQYAVRCNASDNSRVFTAVGYTVENSTYEFSAEIKTASYSSLTTAQ